MKMNPSHVIDLVLSSIIFALPKKLLVDSYLKVRKLINSRFRSKNSSKEAEDAIDIANESEILSELDLRFREACKAVQKSSYLSHQQSLEFYGLYKQALIGDCTFTNPGLGDIVKLKKW
jgi:hypothetical protein